jgi:hypothetical protein
MAKTKRKRRKKHRGTQGGRVAPSRAKPRSRDEAKARARQRRSGGSGAKARGPQRGLTPPSWKGAIGKGGLASLLFFALFAGVFHRPVGSAAAAAVAALAMYVPFTYYLDGFFYRRRNRQQQSGGS